MTGATCHVCGEVGYCELHHIVYRSQATYMKMMNINLIMLCQNHHRGNMGVHNNKKLDLKLKLELQTKLRGMFTKKFYSREEIKKLLKCTEKDLDLTLKKLCCYRLGYGREQLIMRLMGGRLYD